MAELLTPKFMYRGSDDGVESKKMKKEENGEDAGEQENGVKKEESDDS